MLKNKLTNKVVTLSLVLVVLTVYTIPTIENNNILRTNFEIEDITSLKTNSIYLLNKDNLLVEVEIINDKISILEKVKEIINYLTINNRNIPKGLKGYLEENIKILNISLNDKVLYLDVNKFNNDSLYVTGFIYSLLNLKGIDKVKLTINGKQLMNYPEFLDKSISINNRFLFYNRTDINKVVIYYFDNINNHRYFVPVTEYVNDNREKVEIIIEELKNNQDLISLVSNDLELINYSNVENVLFLNFNNKLISDNKKIVDEVINEIAYSCFANYDVNMIMFEVDGKKFTYRKRK